MRLKKITSIVLCFALVLSFIPIKPVMADGVLQDVTDGLVAKWTFDDTTNELNGIPNATSSKITYTNGIYGKAAVFNGVDSYLKTTENQSKLLLKDNFTISFWAYNEDAADKDEMYLYMGRNCDWDHDVVGVDYDSPYSIGLYHGGTVNVRLSDCYSNSNTNVSNSEYTEYSDKTVDGREWFLMTLTYDGSVLKVYRDDQLLGQKNYEYGTCINPHGLFIGVDENYEQYFKGKMDDLRMYNRSLSYNEVSTLYKNGVFSAKELLSPEKKVVAKYSFNDNTNDDSIYKNNAQKVEVNGTLQYLKGKKGNAIEVKNGNYIKIPATDQLNFDHEMTVSYWLKVNNECELPVLYRFNPAYGADEPNNYTFQTWVHSYGTTDIKSGFIGKVWRPDGWSPDSEVSTDYSISNLPNTVWHHYTFTVKYNADAKQSVAMTYVDGELKNTSTSSDNTDLVNGSGDLYIGFDGTEFLTGAIDELTFYNYALDATQVKGSYQDVDIINLSGFSAKLSEETFVYSNEQKKPAVTVDGLIEGLDYTVSYQDNVNAGTAKAVITGMGCYVGTITKTFTITPISINDSEFSLSADSFDCTGKEIKPKVTASGLTENKDYTVTYLNITKPGKATVVISGIGNYTGTISKTFDILLNIAKGKLSKVTTKAKSITVKWSKNSSVSGYQVSLSLKKSKTSIVKTVNGTKVTSFVKKGLKKGKIYYIKVRNYKTVAGTKYYGSWSTMKKCKCK